MEGKQKKVFDPQKVSIFDIKIESNLQILHPFELGKTEMVVGFSTSIAHNIEANNLKINLDIQLQRDDETTDIAEFSFEFYFKVFNLKDFCEIKEEEFFLSTQVAVPLVGVAISTARGIIFERLHDTKWKNVFIPIVSPKNILEQSSN